MTEPALEGEALGVTHEQRRDPYKAFGDLHDHIKTRRQQRAEKPDTVVLHLDNTSGVYGPWQPTQQHGGDRG